MNVTTSRKPVAIGLAAALALGSVFVPGVTGTANAAPLSTNALALKEAAPSDVVDVRRWRRNHGAAVAGLALGIIGSALIAREYDRRHRRHYESYYAPNYYYGGGYAPQYRYRHHQHHRHHNRGGGTHLDGVM